MASLSFHDELTGLVVVGKKAAYAIMPPFYLKSFNMPL